jgi:hypothetical protein
MEPTTVTDVFIDRRDVRPHVFVTSTRDGARAHRAWTAREAERKRRRVIRRLVRAGQPPRIL